MTTHHPIFLLGVVGGLVASATTAEAQSPCDQPVARVESLRNDVRVTRAQAVVSRAAALSVELCVGDAVETGDRSRAVVVLLASDTPMVVDQNSRLVVTASPTQDPASASFSPGRWLVEVIHGAVLFVTREPRALGVEAGFVNALVEGTEFLVRVQDELVQIWVFEGIVSAESPEGNLRLTARQQGEFVPGEAPRRIVIDVAAQRDAVRWAVHYEALFPPDPTLRDAPSGAQATDPEAHVRWADALLRAGRVDEATQAADRASMLLAEAGQTTGELVSQVYALRATVDVARGEVDAALENGSRAVEADPDAEVARIADSYALQASFDLPAARRTLLALLPNGPTDDAQGRSAPFWARLSEIQLSVGELEPALRSARLAVQVNPQVARAHEVQGFAALAQLRIAEGQEAFEEALRQEPDSPLARLGLGLARIRQGDLEGGRRHFEVAVALDPTSSILRSYLGKAYFEERREPLPEEQLRLAAELDRRDPTPLLYDAIRKQTLNRPVEALRDLERAIELNDSRGVYRSRLLLDGDIASRGARLGRIYRDLGFDQPALLQGWQSLAVDPASHSAHRLLADTYLTLPRHEIARDSALLQSQLLQPLNLLPVQPRLADNGLVFLDDSGVSPLGFNEYTRLFVSDQVRVVADVVGGSQDTGIGNVLLSGIHDRVSFSVGQFHYQTAGTRDNNDARQNIFNGFVQAELTSRTSVQMEVRAVGNETGERRFLFDPGNFFATQRSESDTSSVRLGVRHRFGPRSILLGSYVHRNLNSDLDTGVGFAIATDEGADFGEVRYLHDADRVHLTGGFGLYEGDSLEQTSVGPVTLPPAPRDSEHTNGYVYATVLLPGQVHLTGGLSGDSLTRGLLDRQQVNPKVGVTWNVTPRTVLRAAAFRVLKRTLISSQTIEPITVSGFNQLFDDPNGTDAWRSGVGVDQRVSSGGFLGAELSKRDLTVPIVDDNARQVVDTDREERLGRLYLYATATDQWAFGVEYRYERVFDPVGRNELQLRRATIHRVPLEVRFFDPRGVSGRLRVTRVTQTGEFRDLRFNLFPDDDRFWTTDLTLAYRFSNQRGQLVLDVRNLLDNEFRFQDTDRLNPTIMPGRLVLLRLTVGL